MDSLSSLFMHIVIFIQNDEIIAQGGPKLLFKALQFKV